LKKVTVKAHPNIALVKYWGKRDEDLKIPFNNSISLTLDSIYTLTSIEIIESNQDKIIFSNRDIKQKEKDRIIKFLDIFRNTFNKKDLKFSIVTENNFPTASGLASSSSGFCALGVGLNELLEINLDKKEISKFTRIGSGSACRSIYGGFVEWEKGILSNGNDSYASQIVDENYWDLRMLITVIDDKEKSKSSTNAMKETVLTSPFYQAWLNSIEKDLNEVRSGILERDFEKLGKTIEHNCLKMHSTMFASFPPTIFWQAETISIIKEVYLMREKGLNCYFTIDAGANVKILCLPNETEKIKSQLSQLSGVKNIIECKIGKSPKIFS